MRTYALTLAGGLVLGACSGSTNGAAENRPGDRAGAEAARAAVSTGEETCDDPFEGENPLFSPEGWDTNFCKHSVPYVEIMSGGPPRDGIPPIDEPGFVDVDEADSWIGDQEPVIALEIGDDARAYPLQILIWHEVANDTVGGRPVAVTFCPLCYAALVFVRPEVDGQRLTFGTSGNLRKSDLVMWDRQTESWWQQFTGEAIVGRLTGTTLEPVPANIISWKEFKAKYGEDAKVLSRDTGHDRPYGQNPYVGYDHIDKQPFMYKGEVSGKLPPMARIVGVEVATEGRAYPYELLKEKKVVNDELGGRRLAVFWAPGTASAMDAARIAEGADIGTTEVFSRRVQGMPLTFEAAGEGRFRDTQTGTVWDIHGDALEGRLAGEQLEPLVHHDVFWFVWSAFEDAGDLYQAE